MALFCHLLGDALHKFLTLITFCLYEINTCTQEFRTVCFLCMYFTLLVVFPVLMAVMPRRRLVMTSMWRLTTVSSNRWTTSCCPHRVSRRSPRSITRSVGRRSLRKRCNSGLQLSSRLYFPLIHHVNLSPLVLHICICELSQHWFR